MNKKIIELFKTRDKAVLTHDKKSFLSTQKGELARSMSGGYMRLSGMKSEVLFVAKENNVFVVLVKEKYYLAGKLSHTGYLLMKVVKMKEKYKMISICY